MPDLIIKVKNLTVPSEYQYQASAYPGDGAYLNHQGLLAVVCNGNVTTLHNCGSLCIAEPAELLAASPAAGGISESTLLKAMAIASGRGNVREFDLNS